MSMCANVGDRGGAHMCHLQNTMFGSLFSSFPFKWISGIRLDHQEYAAVSFPSELCLWLVLQTNKQKTRGIKLVSNNDVIDFWVMCLEYGSCSVAEMYLHRLERPHWFLGHVAQWLKRICTDWRDHTDFWLWVPYVFVLALLSFLSLWFQSPCSCQDLTSLSILLRSTRLLHLNTACLSAVLSLELMFPKMGFGHLW